MNQIRWVLLLSLLVLLVPRVEGGTEPERAFLRGDANQDGVVDLSDALATLELLFLEAGTSSCRDAIDANDDGNLDISDALVGLNYLFLGAVAPPPPGPLECGLDPTEDLLDCASFAACVPPGEARILLVGTRGKSGAFTFSVTIESPETGCSQYADWWEVVSTEGALLYRRVLLHSHVTEQPFTRSGGPVAIGSDTPVYVRAHMNSTGYGTQVQFGTPAEGFAETALETGQFAELADEQPLPTGCAF